MSEFDFIYGIIERMEKYGHARNIDTTIVGNKKRVDFDRRASPTRLKVKSV